MTGQHVLPSCQWQPFSVFNHSNHNLDPALVARNTIDISAAMKTLFPVIADEQAVCKNNSKTIIWSYTPSNTNEQSCSTMDLSSNMPAADGTAFQTVVQADRIPSTAEYHDVTTRRNYVQLSPRCKKIKKKGSQSRFKTDKMNTKQKLLFASTLALYFRPHRIARSRRNVFRSHRFKPAFSSKYFK